MPDAARKVKSQDIICEVESPDVALEAERPEAAQKAEPRRLRSALTQRSYIVIV